MRLLAGSSLLVLYTALSYLCAETHAKSGGYKYCLFECGNCVVLWGDELYDGKKCATCCLHSNGAQLDHECTAWVKNNIHYNKKDEEYARSVFGRQQKRWSSNLDYKSIYGNGEVPEYCYGR